MQEIVATSPQYMPIRSLLDKFAYKEDHRAHSPTMIETDNVLYAWTKASAYSSYRQTIAVRDHAYFAAKFALQMAISRAKRYG